MQTPVSARLFAILAAIALPVLSPAADDAIRADPARMQQRIDALAQFGANPEGGVSRVAFSDADLAGRAWLKVQMAALGLDVRTDAAGNVIGRREGMEPDLPVILFGSHIDSVPGGGNYDGQVGVVGALEAISLLNAHDITTRHPLEVVSFTDEEGGLTGSRAVIGKLTMAAMEFETHSGYTIADGIARVGGDPTRIEEAVLDPAEVAAFLELHIEQGAFLHQDGVDIGVVEGIVGIRQWYVTIEGVANHGGTTPMDKRFDALVTAADIVLTANRIAKELEGRQVATVGQIEAFPGAPNVVPGRVVMSLEIRDLDAQKMQTVFETIRDAAFQVANTRGTSVNFEELDVASPPAPTEEAMRDVIAGAAEALGYSYRRMPSGAGHDAQDLAKITPTGMIFVPSVDGVSHSPREYTSAQDMANGATVLLHAIIELDKSLSTPEA